MLLVFAVLCTVTAVRLLTNHVRRDGLAETAAVGAWPVSSPRGDTARLRRDRSPVRLRYLVVIALHLILFTAADALEGVLRWRHTTSGGRS